MLIKIFFICSFNAYETMTLIIKFKEIRMVVVVVIFNSRHTLNSYWYNLRNMGNVNEKQPLKIFLSTKSKNAISSIKPSFIIPDKLMNYEKKDIVISLQNLMCTTILLFNFSVLTISSFCLKYAKTFLNNFFVTSSKFLPTMPSMAPSISFTFLLYRNVIEYVVHTQKKRSGAKHSPLWNPSSHMHLAILIGFPSVLSN